MALKLNPLRGVDSLGKAIGLQTKFKNDYSGNKVVEDAFARRAAKEKEEKDLFSPLDIKIDTTKVEPYWAEKIQNEVARYGSIYARAKSLNKDNAFAMVQPAYAKMQTNIAGWLRSNEEFGKYKTQGDGHYKNTDLITKVRTPGAKDEEVLAFNEKIGNVQITPEGMFSYEPVKQFNEPVEFDETYDFTELPTERVPSPIPGYYQTRKPRAVSADAYQRKIAELTFNPVFSKSVIMEFPELKNAPPNVVRAKTLEVAKQYVDAKMPSTTYKYGTERIPTSTGSGSDKDKREKPVVVKNTRASVLLGTGEVVEENGLQVPVKKNVDGFIPLSISVAKTPAQTIPMDSRMIDATTNEYFKGEDLNQNVVFKPDAVYTEAIKKSGKFEKYVLGTATVNKIDRKGVKTEKIITMKVPYDKVQSPIEGAYDLSDFDMQFNELQKTPYKKTEGASQSTAPKPTKGKLY